MKRVTGVDQLFLRMLPDSTVYLLVEMVVDYFFLSGVYSDTRSFFTTLDHTFALGSTSLNR